ncbi:vomeronasal type-2 receptor 1-like [Dendropsophus ebraccatus]|uniref:vomeronasal type-2 receptor 1-like n=1 Tax=Dendropsophus ebraccatus TaxID=150705 RepID=UPI003831A9BA
METTSVLTLEILLLLLLLLITFSFVNTDRSSACKLNPIPAYEEYEYVQDGDIIIGGIFSVNCLIAGMRYMGMSCVHSWICIKPLHQFYRNLQTFLFTVDQINKDPTLLPNLTLGYHIFDSCAHPGKAIRNVLQILSGPGATVPNYSCRKNWRLAGFIGDQSTSTTLPIIKFLTIFKYPVISYGASDVSLGSRQLFQNFFRTIQNDHETFLSLCELIKHFGWTWVGIITSSDESGVREANLLYHFLNHRYICVAFIISEGLSIQPGAVGHDKEFEMIKKLSAQVVILCGTYHDILFESSVAEYLKGVTVILTPSWAPHIVLIEKYPEIFNCSLSLEPESIVTAEFKHYIDDFHPLKYPKDLLLQNLWMTKFHCLSGNGKKDDMYERLYNIALHNCTGLERMRSTGNHLSHEMYDPVYNAVTLLTKALNPIHLSLHDWNSNQASYRYQVTHRADSPWSTIGTKKLD